MMLTEVFLHVDTLAAGDAVRRLGTVDDKQAMRLLVDQHVLQLREFEGGIAAVAEGKQGLRRIFDDDVDHPGFVVPDDHRADEDGQAVIAGVLKRVKVEMADSMAPCTFFQLSLRRCWPLGRVRPGHRPRVRNVPVRGMMSVTNSVPKPTSRAGPPAPS